jgi:hypothetical protein
MQAPLKNPVRGWRGRAVDGENVIGPKGRSFGYPRWIVTQGVTMPNRRSSVRLKSLAALASPLVLAFAACTSSGSVSGGKGSGGNADAGRDTAAGSGGTIDAREFDSTGAGGSSGGAGSSGAGGRGAAGGGGSAGRGTGGAGGGGGTSGSGTGGGAGRGTGGAGGGGGTSGSGTGGGAGRGTGGAGGGGGTSGGGSGSGGTNVGGSNGQGPFTCTEVLGLEITNEWWSAGFLTDVVDATKFQIKWHHQGYLEKWADPSSPFWANQGNASTPDAGAPIQSPCAKDSLTPDRVLFVAVDFDIVTVDAWVAALSQAVATIKTKYSPNLKWIDLTTLVRCPGDIMCNSSEHYGPGANVDVPLEDCYVPPYVDAAIAQVIAANQDFVGLGPEPQATACDKPVNGPHLSTASNTAAASAYAAYFVQHP